MRTTTLLVSAFVASFAAFACSSTNDDAVSSDSGVADAASADAAADGGSISGNSYSQTCAVDSDCTLIHEGNVCQPCLNQDSAINVSDRTKYDADFTALRNGCGPMPAIACVAIVSRKAACEASKCVSVLIEEDAGSDASTGDASPSDDAGNDAN